jgi:hypothetical protein
VVLPLDDTTMHNIENDEWFVALVKSGRLHVGEDGVVYNPKTKRNIGAASNGRYLKISFQDELVLSETC